VTPPAGVSAGEVDTDLAGVPPVLFVVVATSTDRQRLARAVSAFWEGGAGPSHGQISRVLDANDLQEGDPGGSKADRVYWALQAVDDVGLPNLLLALFDLLVEGRMFDRDYEYRAPDSTVNLARQRLRVFRFGLAEDGNLSGGASLGVRAEALLSLPDLHDHVRRISIALDNDDSALLLGSSKELLETTSKFVLHEVAEAAPSDFPALLTQALRAIGLHAKSVSSDGDVGAATKRIVGGLQQIGVGVNELRNAHGTGHGQVNAVRLGIRHARLAAGSAVVLATLMLDTFEDPAAPWRNASRDGDPKSSLEP
jgi:hypothetical protein